MGLQIRAGAVLSSKMVDAMLTALPVARSAQERGLLRHITFAVSAAIAPRSDRALARVLAAAEASLYVAVVGALLVWEVFAVGTEVQQVEERRGLRRRRARQSWRQPRRRRGRRRLWRGPGGAAARGRHRVGEAVHPSERRGRRGGVRRRAGAT